MSCGTPAIFLPFLSNGIQYSALYQLYKSQSLLKFRRTEYRQNFLHKDNRNDRSAQKGTALPFQSISGSSKVHFHNSDLNVTMTSSPKTMGNHYIYHFSTVIDFSSEKYSGSTGHRNSWYQWKNLQ